MSVADSAHSFAQNASDIRGKFEVPQVQVPEQLAKLNETLTARLPQPSEIVKANFELTERLLCAQKELTLKVLAFASTEAPAPAAKATKSAK